MAKQDGSSALKAIPLFSDLSRRDLNVLSKQLKEEFFKPGQDLITEGAPGGRMFFVVDGQVKILRSGGRTRTAGPGAILGELSILDRGPRTATVRADGPVHALSMSSVNFLSVLDEYPSIAKAVMTSLAKRLRACDKTLMG